MGSKYVALTLTDETQMRLFKVIDSEQLYNYLIKKIIVPLGETYFQIAKLAVKNNPELFEKEIVDYYAETNKSNWSNSDTKLKKKCLESIAASFLKMTYATSKKIDPEYIYLFDWLVFNKELKDAKNEARRKIENDYWPIIMELMIPKNDLRNLIANERIFTKNKEYIIQGKVSLIERPIKIYLPSDASEPRNVMITSMLDNYKKPNTLNKLNIQRIRYYDLKL